MHVIGLILALWAAVAAAALDKAQRVPISVIFRAYCPACQWYIGDPLIKLISDPAFRAITELSLNPAAGMTETDAGFDCTGGPSECEGHRWFACILDKDKDSVETYMKHMAARDGSDTWQSRLEFCYPDPVAIAALRKCKTEDSTRLLRQLTKEAQALDLGWMPYTIVKGGVVGDVTKGVMLKDLKLAVCNAYSGPDKYLPIECYGLLGRPTPAVASTTVVVPAALAAATSSPLTTQPPTTTALPTTLPAAAKIQLQVVWRAFCPACKWYLNDPLLRVLQDPEFTDILTFKPYPSGSTTGTNGAFSCTGGPSECMGHRYMSCAIHLYPVVAEQAKHLACMEDEKKPRGAWDKIVSMCFRGPAIAQMKACYQKDSAKLLEKFIETTNTVDTPWLPHTTVDGTILGSPTEGVSYDMLTLGICNAYKGPRSKRPRACPPLAADVLTTVPPTTTTVRPAVAADTDDEEDDKKDAPVRPCINREKGFVYEDAPDIGKRGLRKGAEKPVKLQVAVPASSSLASNPLLVPVLLLGTILFIVVRFSKTSEKKDM
ncbi:hypothetical protein SPRG_12725 [Saprolegnia parasitica CBS 223.65]|uniref:Thioredoxin domain-containing protein n=1 Tax=Saprolegnia parasitica (strain CBS 223.65) TaxID=695850 RepID=A0A067BV75_SAPPC|nr:hypothetical protein SPRG_12725 [Saprolegnia parasitica CBS 223.65]KDO22444.1 hypothetical protein SPRG_12725 [Saprolegnia parasitica CBS 223.65]|eukprot:XP_012206832.1 hypothetical protein SPRG_12725 [Saprolegnia parasitica CBS 223.65]